MWDAAKGRSSRRLPSATRGGALAGVDLSAHAIALARRRLPQARFQVLDLPPPPAPPRPDTGTQGHGDAARNAPHALQDLEQDLALEACDLVVCSDVLEHIEDD